MGPLASRHALVTGGGIGAAFGDITRAGAGEGRRIVFIASTAGMQGYAYVAAFCAAKTGRSAQAARNELARDNANGRLVTPAEVAQTVLWLCLPSAGSINGQAIAVAGGAV